MQRRALVERLLDVSGADAKAVTCELDKELQRRRAHAQYNRNTDHAFSPDQADLVVVNTCSVTASADQGARQTIRRIARANPGARMVVTGCYATRRPGEVGGLPNVAEVVPNDDKPRLVQLLRRSETPRRGEDRRF